MKLWELYYGELQPPKKSYTSNESWDNGLSTDTLSFGLNWLPHGQVAKKLIFEINFFFEIFFFQISNFLPYGQIDLGWV